MSTSLYKNDSHEYCDELIPRPNVLSRSISTPYPKDEKIELLHQPKPKKKNWLDLEEEKEYPINQQIEEMRIFED